MPISESEPHFFFDAYSATITQDDETEIFDFETCLAKLLDPIRDQVATRKDGGGMQGYTRSVMLNDHGKTQIVLAMTGGNPGAHFQIKGTYSEVLARHIKTVWPNHRSSRADSALDLSGEGLFDDLLDFFEIFAHERNLDWKTIGDMRPAGLRKPGSGRTFYLGSEDSRAYLRVYEKGLHILSDKKHVGEINRNWVRAELEYKVNGRAAKEALAKLPPIDIWALSPWTRSALQHIIGLALPKRILCEPRKADAYRAVTHMLRQYRNSLLEVIHNEGGYARFLVWARNVWKAQRPELDEYWGQPDPAPDDWTK
jgi:hypothetical protein